MSDNYLYNELKSATEASPPNGAVMHRWMEAGLKDFP